MSAGAGDDAFAHEQRTEIFMRLSAVERKVDAAVVTLEQSGKLTEHRLTSVEDSIRGARSESKEEHRVVEAKMEELEKSVAAVAQAVAAARLSAKDILLATSPLSVAIIALIGVLISGGGS